MKVYRYRSQGLGTNYTLCAGEGLLSHEKQIHRVRVIVNQRFLLVVLGLRVAIFYQINRLVSSYLHLVSLPAPPTPKRVVAMRWERLHALSVTGPL